MSDTKFTIDLDNARMIVEREFNAPVNLVWRAWTEEKYLGQWWAPKPWKCETGKMDFREGGQWLYAMVGPEGEKHWGKAEYDEIATEKYYIGRDVFCDENGTTNEELPQANWKVEFQADGEKTRVTMTTDYPSKEQLETVINMGMKEGLTMTLEALSQLLVEWAA